MARVAGGGAGEVRPAGEIPLLITPGHVDVVHRDEGKGRFTLSMRFTHPWAGETLFQSGTFEDPRP